MRIEDWGLGTEDSLFSSMAGLILRPQKSSNILINWKNPQSPVWRLEQLVPPCIHLDTPTGYQHVMKDYSYGKNETPLPTYQRHSPRHTKDAPPEILPDTPKTAPRQPPDTTRHPPDILQKRPPDINASSSVCHSQCIIINASSPVHHY